MSARAFIVLLALVATGCKDDRSPDEIRAAHYERVSDLITEHTLSDGTRCAAIEGERKAAISCDWGRK